MFRSRFEKNTFSAENLDLPIYENWEDMSLRDPEGDYRSKGGYESAEAADERLRSKWNGMIKALDDLILDWH
ncbi:MAG: hypothetical protein LBL49_08690 [Clostridiales Family XIII bacterium]|jgi:hypothetical protein|nr:hypothetical protein [Clostridiales Family XIII bacterium]